MLRRSALLGAGAGLLALSARHPARADTLDNARRAGKLTIGTEAAYVPYEFFKDGEIVGYDVDIADQLTPKIGVKAEFIDTAWNGIIPALYGENSTASFPA